MPLILCARANLGEQLSFCRPAKLWLCSLCQLLTGLMSLVNLLSSAFNMMKYQPFAELTELLMSSKGMNI